MITQNQIIFTARKYLGFPYRSQGRDSYGVDCGGLIILVCRELGITNVEFLGYSNSPDGKTFEKLLQQDLDEISKDQTSIGDIIACDYGLGIQHTAFVTQTVPYLKIIHAKRGRGVIEHRLMKGMDDFDSWIKTFRIRQ